MGFQTIGQKIDNMFFTKVVERILVQITKCLETLYNGRVTFLRPRSYGGVSMMFAA